MSRLYIIALPAALLAAAPVLAHGPEEHASRREAPYGAPGDANSESRVVELVMQEGAGRMSFAPEVVTVSKGEQIRFHLVNAGVLDHEFVLGTPEEIEEHADMMRAMPDMVHDDPNAKRLGPNAVGDIFWRFTTAGEFDFACLIPGHMEAGMKGKIIVK